MIRNKELLLPTHKDRTAIERVLHRQVGLLELVLHMAEGGESRPVDHILLLSCAPIPRQEPVATSNYLGVKVGRKLWPVVCQAADSEVAAQVRGRKVNVLGFQVSMDESSLNQSQCGQYTHHDGHIHVVAISATLLRSLEGGAGV